MRHKRNARKRLPPSSEQALPGSPSSARGRRGARPAGGAAQLSRGRRRNRRRQERSSLGSSRRRSVRTPGEPRSRSRARPHQGLRERSLRQDLPRRAPGDDGLGRGPHHFRRKRRDRHHDGRPPGLLGRRPPAPSSLATRRSKEKKLLSSLLPTCSAPLPWSSSRCLGDQLKIPVFNVPGESPLAICAAARGGAKKQGRDVIIYDTAGRLRDRRATHGRARGHQEQDPRRRTSSWWSMR